MPDSPLWTPSPERIATSRLTEFTNLLSRKLGVTFGSYSDLYQWSIDNIESFWSEIWSASDIIYSKFYDGVLDRRVMPGARWFTGAKLNFAENLLRYRDDRVATIQCGEDVTTREILYSELYLEVARCASGLRNLGVTKGDRVAAFAPNIPETVIMMLATTSIGAIWSSCSPDFGQHGAMDRFGQIQPKVFFCADGYRYAGKQISSLERIGEIVGHIPSIEHVVILPYLGIESNLKIANSLTWAELLDQSAPEIEFEQCDFNDPVYILYSSGTTGKPKCIVHGAGGTLLQHWKEHALHTNITRDDTLFYFTTCGWMMWNWLVSGLQMGCTIVLYEGSPAYPNLNALWSMAELEQVSVFGTSPKFLSACQKAGLSPRQSFKLSKLRTILSTGAPLTGENFAWVYSEVKPDVQLSSISGGTDIVSCFMLGNPNLPVYSEEIQCRGLGMSVKAYDDNARPVINEVGELVCDKPFPSAPVSFWNDPDMSLYRAAYFEEYPGIWRHGDFIKITPHGGVIVYGRSDATLNPGGVRIGTAEIYNPVEALDEVADSIVIGQKWKNDTRIVLFVALKEGITLDEELRIKIRDAIRASATPRHVPSLIFQVSEIPHTISGKKVEIAVTRLIHGQTISNRDALANPKSLDQFTAFTELDSVVR